MVEIKEEAQEEEPQAPEEPTSKKSQEVIDKEIDSLCIQLHQKFNAWPMPPMTKDLQKEAFQSNESLFKMKLMNFTEKLLALSAVEFDKICIGRIER